MTNATTFVLSNADLSVPAGAIDIDRTTAEARFFGLLREAKPDVILLDLTDGSGAGPEAIRTIRLKCRVPILVVCDINDRRLFEYRVAGATECIPSPLDLVRLNQTLTQIRITGDRARILPRLETLYFSGFEFHSSENRVIGATGSCVKLTALENQLLLYFSSNPYVLCTRIEIAEKLYGRHRPSDRAVDILVTRLRKKLSRLSSTQPIRTEYRRGYVFEGEVSARPEAEQC